MIISKGVLAPQVALGALPRRGRQQRHRQVLLQRRPYLLDELGCARRPYSCRSVLPRPSPLGGYFLQESSRRRRPCQSCYCISGTDTRRAFTEGRGDEKNDDQKTTLELEGAWQQLKEERRKDIEALPEFEADRRLENFLRDRRSSSVLERIQPPAPPPGGYEYELTNGQWNTTIDAMLATFAVHVESRVAALLGKGFYTIGPCGEEALASAAFALRGGDRIGDSMALHYRHLAINLTKQLQQQQQIPGDGALKQILLDRARGYTVSRYDPVTGGVHCSIGSRRQNDSRGEVQDFLVTSTLASQCPPAVGRALGYALSPAMRNINKDKNRRANSPVSFVTVGDGSVHNHHFWSAFHLARHARHRSIKCPVVFGISDNGMSISYQTQGYVDTLFGHDPLVPVYVVNGNDAVDVYSRTRQATEYARHMQSPVVVLYKNLVRRFGHAASDRQFAYLDEEQIQGMADTNVIESALVQAVDLYGSSTYEQVYGRYLRIKELTHHAFAVASQEPKVTRQDMLQRVSAPMVAVPSLPKELRDVSLHLDDRHRQCATELGRREVMRKHMTSVIRETLKDDDTVVYIGEDVQHGGYYVVTEGLAAEFPNRVLDFPPDETSLLGSAMGFSQVGLLPIVEIPYAKYLDCGADMFYEIAASHWLTSATANGASDETEAGKQLKRNNGMVIRLQGFDRGLFGGNFHTHNALQHIPPGVDVVCYSNGEDYVRGFRNAILQAKNGRIVMLVDSTHLLNLRHLFDKDRVWERCYPSNNEVGTMRFDEVRRYGTQGCWAVLSYGNGVVTSLQARRSLLESGLIASENEVDVIDCPYLSDVPDGLHDIIGQYRGILFADPCKAGPGSSVLAPMVTFLQDKGMLPANKWKLVAAPRTYNPLGSLVTFLNVDDIVLRFKEIIHNS